MVLRTIDVRDYDREFCSSSSSSSSTSRVANSKTKHHKVMKFCKNVDIHNATKLHIFIFGLLIQLAVNNNK